jgi:N-methylhydantoinase A/oxoprolinase/acetone carboxylase beta subunit
MKRLGVDVGGTFTDLIHVDDESGTITVHKIPTTPADPSQGTVRGIRELCDGAGTAPSQLEQVFHGTTIATNIVIEHNGAQVGLITTEGYRDILHIARHKKPLNFSNYQDLPWQRYPIVRRRHRLTVPERITRDGSVLVPLDETKAREQIAKLKEAGVESVAVCFLFSFLNPEHEARVAEILREAFPDAFLSISSEVLPQYREYERFSTVCLNAYIGPRVSSYVHRLEQELEAMDVRTGLHLMTSASGVATAEGAIARPVNLLMSGPVAGVVGGIWAGRQAGYDNVITLDVGGTSADIGLAQEGRLRMKHLLDTRVGPYQAMIPMVDVDTIGAGGGSIAYVDSGGIFRVGPRSAGADPGPAAYGRGGTEATATDAMVNLGWLLPETFLGGGNGPRRGGCRRAFEEGPAGSLGMSGRGGVRWVLSRSSPTRWCSRSRRTPCARATTRGTSPSSPRAARGRCSPRRSRSRWNAVGSRPQTTPASPRRSDYWRPTWSTSTSRRCTSGCPASTPARSRPHSRSSSSRPARNSRRTASPRSRS